MVIKWFITALSLGALGLTGCASLQPREAFPKIAGQVQERTGARVVWNQGSEPDREVADALHGLLARELSADDAVQIALLNNRTAQATYEELGIAQAELVQAGLLKNPVFSVLARFPEAGKGSADVELSVTEDFIQLLSLPLRKKVAAAQYEAAKARVTGEIVNLSADVRQAFYRLQGAQQMVEMRRSVVAATGASLDARKRLREAGNITELELANEQALYGQARIDLARSEAELVKGRERVLALLGLWGPEANIKVAARLPDLPPSDMGVDHIEAVAIRQRLDLAAAVKELNATYQSLGLTQQFTWLNGSELSVDGERGTDGSWVTGPGLTLPIPIFDTGAAQVSIARSRIRQATARLYALAVQIRSDARSARAEMLAARDRANYYRTSLVPLRRKITQQTQLQYNAMIMGVFQLLQAKRDEIDAGRDYIESIQDYWLARTELERAIGGKLPSGDGPTSEPAAGAMPADMGGDSSIHQHHP
jgi:cobalt-zinc-cadmium efflux system outer membrane protein